MDRVACSKCGASILPATAVRNRGICTPCATGLREVMEAEQECRSKMVEIERPGAPIHVTSRDLTYVAHRKHWCLMVYQKSSNTSFLIHLRGTPEAPDERAVIIVNHALHQVDSLSRTGLEVLNTTMTDGKCEYNTTFNLELSWVSVSARSETIFFNFHRPYSPEQEYETGSFWVEFVPDPTFRAGAFCFASCGYSAGTGSTIQRW